MNESVFFVSSSTAFNYALLSISFLLSALSFSNPDYHDPVLSYDWFDIVDPRSGVYWNILRITTVGNLRHTTQKIVGHLRRCSQKTLWFATRALVRESWKWGKIRSLLNVGTIKANSNSNSYMYMKYEYIRNHWYGNTQSPRFNTISTLQFRPMTALQLSEFVTAAREYNQIVVLVPLCHAKLLHGEYMYVHWDTLG